MSSLFGFSSSTGIGNASPTMLTPSQSMDEESPLMMNGGQDLHHSIVPPDMNEDDHTASTASLAVEDINNSTSTINRRAVFHSLTTSQRRTARTGFRESVKVARPPQPRRIVYDSSQNSHFRILTQLYGSVWPHVIPYCIVNVLWTILVYLLLKHEVADLTFSSLVGHQFMGIMVSFLVVSRSNIAYARFMEARAFLSSAYRSCREVVQFTCILTMQHKEETAKLWRREVAYRTILMLRIAMAAIEYRSSKVNTWEVLPPEQDSLELHQNPFDHSFRLSRWAHGERSLMDENFRAPFLLAYNLRETVMKQRNGKYLKERMHVNEELRIINAVGDFMTAFHGLKKLISTPFPFPLVQMCRTFLFFWIFTLPMVLVPQMTGLIKICSCIFIITYGFLGIEYVSMELDDPFGDDPNDFDDLGMAQIVFEDIYLYIVKADGVTSAAELRSQVSERVAQGGALENFRNDIQNESFWALRSSP